MASKGRCDGSIGGSVPEDNVGAPSEREDSLRVLKNDKRFDLDLDPK